MGPLAYRQTDCDSSCANECTAVSPDDFYAGQRPLARFFGLTSCPSGSCGEVYVDEWLNEPPIVDQCGHDECVQCGHAPVRSLIRVLLGNQYMGTCENCDQGGSISLGHGSIIQDGYEPGKWSSQRGCNCQSPGHHASEHHEYHESHRSMEPPAIDGESIMNDSSKIAPPAQSSPTGSGGRNAPTPAPALTPNSASRLNPAARRLVR